MSLNYKRKNFINVVPWRNLSPQRARADRNFIAPIHFVARNSFLHHFSRHFGTVVIHPPGQLPRKPSSTIYLSAVVAATTIASILGCTEIHRSVMSGISSNRSSERLRKRFAHSLVKCVLDLLRFFDTITGSVSLGTFQRCFLRLHSVPSTYPAANASTQPRKKNIQ